MNKKTALFILTLFCLVLTYGFQKQFFNTKNVFDKIEGKDSTLTNCFAPLNAKTKNIKRGEVTIYWADSLGNSWEYYVVPLDDPKPIGGTGIIKTISEDNKVTEDSNGNPLTPDTEYEFWVRTDCGKNGYSSWEGPFEFKTLCGSNITPFEEGFNTNSGTMNCWTIIDVNDDATSPNGNNIWKSISSVSSFYEGDRGMYFYGVSTNNHDDWLISPEIEMTGELYAITFHYKTLSSSDNEFEVLLSTNGKDPANFTHVLMEKKKRNENEFIKKTVYVEDITAEVNIAWHIESKGTTYMYLDLISVEKVDCKAPDYEVNVIDLEKDKVTINWKDSVNNAWEYYVQLDNGAPIPVGGGVLATKKEVEITRISSSGANLQPDTKYEFYVRSTCGIGKVSKWVGPIKFRTPCDEFSTPFWEGFNADSASYGCWKIVDNNNDGDPNWGENLWELKGWDVYEGDQAMGIETWGSSNPPNDDWLISPAILMDASKVYRLKYHYRANVYDDNKFEVLASTSGNTLNSFTTVIVPENTYKNSTWLEGKRLISGLGGVVYFAWHVKSANGTELFLDDISIEEVEGCAEPQELGVKHEGKDNAVLFWDDEFGGTEWEYVVRKKGKGLGDPKLPGAISKSKEVNVDKDYEGKSLEPNTEYEYYVRTVCGNGEYSVWSGPYKFRTTCSIVGLPFWEGFNTTSNTIYCWNIFDENNDSTSPTGSNIWRSASLGYEGNQSMYFSGTTGKTHDDWLVSPTLKLDASKVYRLKYHYRTSTSADNHYEFEVLLSTKGLDVKNFNQTIVAKKKYGNTIEWKEEHVFIKGVSGNVHLAWHVTSKDATYIYIDNVFVEEVEECAEPTKLNVSNINSRSVDINWTDEFGGTNWEYVVQKYGKGEPTGSGLATSNTTISIIRDFEGENLEPNTDYEFYVRTPCGNGEFSVWSGPFKFTTPCDVYDTPFWDGFNSDTQTLRCWTIYDNNGDSTSPTSTGVWRIVTVNYEGDQSMSLYSSKTNVDIPDDDWLITPGINMDGGMYVLKYHYLARESTSSSKYKNEFEVLLSTNGVDTDEFKKIILPKEEYSNDQWKEQVVFINGVNGIANIGWHVVSQGEKYNYIYLDNVSVKKVETCPEPYYARVIDQTEDSIEIEWEQIGGIDKWEIIVEQYGQDPQTNTIREINVTGNPRAVIDKLGDGRSYTIYVRAVCSTGKDKSDWSTGVDTATEVGANDSCSGAITLPVNSGKECNAFVSATLFGADLSSIGEPTCGTMSRKKDVWFEFTAKASTHLLSLSDYYSFSDTRFPAIYGSLYDQNCSAISNVALDCFVFSSSMQFTAFRNLIVGNKYYVRLASTLPNPDFIFNLCMTTDDFIDVSPSGDKYTVEELVKEILVVSDCDLVSNISYVTGTTFGQSNSIGYFTKNNSSFNFESGIILATNGVQYGMGPSGLEEGYDSDRWIGDADLQQVLMENGQTDRNYNATVLEFDFIPIRDSLKFDFIFASNEYGPGYQCSFTDVFAFLLTDLTTGEVTNLAVVPGTDIPISVTTIHSAEYQGTQICGDANAQYFDKYYGEIGLDPKENPINYAGMTVPMTAVSAVKPGRKYHIKLAIADYKDTQLNSAVFLKGGSFDLGNIDLGGDLLIENGNAICFGETKTIYSGVSVLEDDFKVDIKWFRDGELIQDEKGSEIEVAESGEYSVRVTYPDLNCEAYGEVIVEIFPSIREQVKEPNDIVICRYTLEPIVINLDEIAANMYENDDDDKFEYTFYFSEENALTEKDSIDKLLSYTDTEGKDVYIRVQDKMTGCYEIFDFSIKLQKGDIPSKPEYVLVCAEYIFPDLEKNQYYYTEPSGQGEEYKTGDILSEPGEHTIYVLQINNEEGCYEEISYKVNITAPVTADIFEDKTLSCEYYELAPLSEHNQYFTEPGGNGDKLYPGMQILQGQTIYVYASSKDSLCIDESSFTIDYEDCPIPKGISPNNDGLNDVFDLTPHGVENIKIYNRWGTEVYSHGEGYTTQWHGQHKNGKQLPDGTYYYVIQAHGKTRTGWVQINK